MFSAVPLRGQHDNRKEVRSGATHTPSPSPGGRSIADVLREPSTLANAAIPMPHAHACAHVQPGVPAVAAVAPPASATHAPRRSEHPVHEGRRARVIASTRVGHGATHIDIINRKCTDRLKCSVQGAAPCNSPHAQALQLVQSRRHREKLDLPQVFLFDIAVQLRGCRRLRVPSPHQRHMQPAALRSLSTF